jgi:aspartyl-tRNA(Asn)/glutamyl-tRNA(Gln) amidotransferase subunit A
MELTAADYELHAMVHRFEAALGDLGGLVTTDQEDTEQPDAPDRANDDESIEAHQLLDAYRSGRRSPVAEVDACLRRIARGDGAVGAIWAVDTARARAAAEHSAARWRAGSARPLEGVPVVVKDLLDTEALCTTGGSRWLVDRLPHHDAAVVEAIRAAGAIIVGKSATFELGCGDEFIPFGTVRNPWASEHTTGGSSAGSAAALAAGFVPLALGTDTGGSIRIPASYCGVTGLKPTLGRLSNLGLLGLAPTLDTPGQMARSAIDAGLLFSVMARTHVSRPPLPSMSDDDVPLRGRTIGLVRRWFCDVLADDVREAFEAASIVLGHLGATVVTLELPHAEHGPTLSWLITMYEAARTYADAPRDMLSDSFRARLEVGERISAGQYAHALTARSALIAAVLPAFDSCDVLVVPGSISTAPPLDDLNRAVAGVECTWPDVTARTMALWNVTGLPSLNVPIGLGGGATPLPIGMQIVGAPFGDELCLAIGQAFQSATDHHRLRPPSPTIRRTTERGT